MHTRSVLAFTVIAAVAVSIPAFPASSYYPSDFVVEHSSASSSSSAVSIMSSASSSMSKSSARSSSSRRSVQAAAASDSSPLPIQTQCVLEAVEKREEAIMDALQNYHAIMERMLQIRKNVIVQGWSEPDENTRNTKLRTLWRTFGSAWRNKGLVMREQRRDAWEAYRSERTACGLYNGDDPEAGGMTLDSQL